MFDYQEPRAQRTRQEFDEVLGLHRPSPLGASGAQWLLRLNGTGVVWEATPGIFREILDDFK